MWENLKAAGGIGLVIGVIVLVAILVGILIEGGVWVSSKVYPWLRIISVGNFILLLFVFLPLALFRRTRSFAADGVVIASYVFGMTVWVWGLLLTYTLWGGFAVAVGLFLVGVGVVPIAMLATMFKGLWSTFGELLFLTIFVFAARFFGMWLRAKAAFETLQRL